MQKKWLTYINAAICLIILILLLAALGFIVARPDEIAVNETAAVRKTLPKGAFRQSTEAYEAINKSIFRLKYSPLTMQLPDLRKALIFYGKNDRPDAKDAKPLLHLAFNGNKTITSASPDEKMYVQYDRSTTPPQYIFSPGNQETPLWIEANANDKEASIKVRMKNDEGLIIQEPWAHAQFTTIQKDYIRTGTPWEIGKWRVDGSLLARQKTRWYGKDRFMENHGGPEFASQAAKQRIDFGENESVYSAFAGVGDAMIWVDDQWKSVKPGVESLGYPLLVIKKIDDRLMQLELWDINGQSKIVLNLLKSNEPWTPDNILTNFKFMGSHTRSQFVFEVNKERMLLSPKDWLVQTPKGWKKLSNPQEIDDYVHRKITGVLFVFDGIARKNDQQYLMGTLYNASRSEAKTVEMPITPTPIGRKKPEGMQDREEPIYPSMDVTPLPSQSANYPIPPNAPFAPSQLRNIDQEKE